MNAYKLVISVIWRTKSAQFMASYSEQRYVTTGTTQLAPYRSRYAAYITAASGGFGLLEYLFRISDALQSKPCKYPKVVSEDAPCDFDALVIVSLAG